MASCTHVQGHLGIPPAAISSLSLSCAWQPPIVSPLAPVAPARALLSCLRRSWAALASKGCSLRAALAIAAASCTKFSLPPACWPACTASCCAPPAHMYICSDGHGHHLERQKQSGRLPAAFTPPTPLRKCNAMKLRNH